MEAAEIAFVAGRWILVSAAGLAALAVTGACWVLAWMLVRSVSDVDRWAGFAVALAGLAWLGLPGAGVWLLWRSSHPGWGFALLCATLVASLVVAKWIMSGAGAAARP